MKKSKNMYKAQRGFTVIEIVIAVVVLAVVGGLIAWRVISTRQAAENQNAQQTAANVVSGPLTPEDQEKVEEAKQQEAAASSGGQPSNTATTSNSSAPTTQAQTPAPSSNSSNTSPAAPSTPPAPAAGPNYTRPTAEFCQQQNGNTFSAWATQNSSHTYQVWENGGWASKTETGTAGQNYDTMQVVGVIPYLKKAAWASCSDKSGYVMFYYQPSGSVYTYNWLVPFGNVTTTTP